MPMAGFPANNTWLITGTCYLLEFNKEDTTAAVFCGSKKSLVHGTVMSNVLFAGNPAIGIILLPCCCGTAARQQYYANGWVSGK